MAFAANKLVPVSGANLGDKFAEYYYYEDAASGDNIATIKTAGFFPASEIRLSPSGKHSLVTAVAATTTGGGRTDLVVVGNGPSTAPTIIVSS